MNLQNIKGLHKKEGGFTIVELLIVIVIIGILAALVIIAYTGIQDRARATKNKTDAQAIVKKAEAFAADDTAGVYPSAATPSTANFGATTVSALGGSLSVSYTTTQLTSNVAANGVGGAAYKVYPCASSGGLRVYYYDPTKPATTPLFTDAGTCP